MKIPALILLAGLAPALGGCLSTAQQQKLIADGCVLAIDLYAGVNKPGPKTQADFAAVTAFCNFGTSPLYATLEDALAAFHADLSTSKTSTP